MWSVSPSSHANKSSPCPLTLLSVVCVVIVGHWLVLAVAILLLCLLFSPLLLVMLISALISAVVDFVGRLLRLMHRALLGGPAQAAVGAAHGGDEVVDDGDMWEVVPV